MNNDPWPENPNAWPEGPLSGCLMVLCYVLSWVVPIGLILFGLGAMALNYFEPFAFATATPPPAYGVDDWAPIFGFFPFCFGAFLLFFRIGGPHVYG